MKFLLNLLFPNDDIKEPIGLSALRATPERIIEEEKPSPEDKSLSFLKMAKDLY